LRKKKPETWGVQRAGCPATAFPKNQASPPSPPADRRQPFFYPMLQTLASLLLALFKAIPALEALVRM
jgi:hypothetical protein